MKFTDLQEIKRMWKKESVCCDRFSACYVDALTGSIEVQESQPLLALTETQLNRHIALIKKMFAGDIGGKVLQVKLAGGVTEELADARDTRFRNEEVMERFFENITNNIPQDNNYVILAYHMVYDIPKKGTDGADQEDSEDVYEHILCMVCPTKVQKTNLAIVDRKLSLSVPSRIVSPPITGIIWPAFDDRSVDEDSIIIYNADEEKTERWLHMKAFNSADYRTTGEIRNTLKDIFDTVMKKEDIAEQYQKAFTEKLGDMRMDDTVSVADFNTLTKKADIPESKCMELSAQYRDKLCAYNPTVYQLMDPDYTVTVVEEKKGTRMRNLLLKAAGVIENIHGTDSELVRDLLSAADMQAGGNA